MCSTRPRTRPIQTTCYFVGAGAQHLSRCRSRKPRAARAQGRRGSPRRARPEEPSLQTAPSSPGVPAPGHVGAHLKRGFSVPRNVPPCGDSHLLGNPPVRDPQSCTRRPGALGVFERRWYSSRWSTSKKMMLPTPIHLRGGTLEGYKNMRRCFRQSPQHGKLVPQTATSATRSRGPHTRGDALCSHPPSARRCIRRQGRHK